MPDYPGEFPLPQLSPYAYVVDVGLLRTPMDGGFARQRRLYDVQPTTWALEFKIPVRQLYAWQTWVNQNAFDFFTIRLASWLSSQAPTDDGVLFPHIVRFTTNLEINLIERAVYQVRVGAELSPAQTSNFSPTPDGNWIIGGRPPAPSNANSVIGGTPFVPSNANTVIGGTPANPSLLGE